MRCCYKWQGIPRSHVSVFELLLLLSSLYCEHENNLLFESRGRRRTQVIGGKNACKVSQAHQPDQTGRMT